MYLEDEFDHFSVDQTVDGLSIDVSDEITSAEPRLLSRAALLHVLQTHTRSRSPNSSTLKSQTCLLSYPNNVVDTVDVTVSNIDSNGSESEAIFLPRAVDSDGRAQHTHSREEVSAGRRVPRGRIRGERVRGHRARQRRKTMVLIHWKKGTC